MMPLRVQILGNLAAAALTAVLLQQALKPQRGRPVQDPLRFTTQENMLAVKIRLHRQAAPEILEVLVLEAGRVSVLPGGDYRLAVQEEGGNEIYSLSFQGIFLTPGDPPQPAESVELILVVTGGPKAHRLKLEGPAGTTELELEP